MAFTLQIKRKGILNNKQLNLNDLLSNCHLDYGSANEFFVLNEGETNEQQLFYSIATELEEESFSPIAK